MSLEHVNWEEIPSPEDEGAADHLVGRWLPSVRLASTAGGDVALATLEGVSVIYVYPMTGRPDRALPDGWDMIPGARGCTPQSCAFRDHFEELKQHGVHNLFGLSTQTGEDQSEAATRLHLPFPLLSDNALAFAAALGLPSFMVDGKRLLKRLTLICRDDQIVHVNYPVFPPDQDVQKVIAWLRDAS